ncbi:MAG: precorrin-8X methylmutase [Clostridia bacterium]|nr:precorrin-8X methylmutase [Clostridia bacterium]
MTEGKRESLVDRYALPAEVIEQRSFAIVEELLQTLPPLSCTPEEREVIVRVVHATGDPSIAASVRFHPRGVEAAVAALAGGATVITDVNMVKAGIDSRLAARLGVALVCAIAEPTVAERARREGTTRAIAAFRELAPRLAGQVVAIGNAPTALLALLDIVDAGGPRPAAVIGVPVGFVASAEAKAELARRDVPFITIEGYRGGSPVAAAIVNALLRLADRRYGAGRAAHGDRQVGDG